MIRLETTSFNTDFTPLQGVEIEEVIKEVDPEETGFMTDMVDSIDDEVINRAFDTFDEDGDGYIIGINSLWDKLGRVGKQLF